MDRLSKARYVSTKQLKNWGWQARPGTIYLESTGKRIYTDYISALWAKLSLRTRYGAQLVSYRDKIDGYIYFSIGDKFYKTPALLD